MTKGRLQGTHAHLGCLAGQCHSAGLIRSAMTEAIPADLWDSKVAEVPMGRARRASTRWPTWRCSGVGSVPRTRRGHGPGSPGPPPVTAPQPRRNAHVSAEVPGETRRTSILALQRGAPMREVVIICEPVRTPIGPLRRDVRPLTTVDLAVTALKGLERTGWHPMPSRVAVLGHCCPSMEATAIGRVVALDAGSAGDGSGMQLDRRCGSGLQAVIQAAPAGRLRPTRSRRPAARTP